MTPRRRNGEPNGERDHALIEVRAGRRAIPVTMKNIALLITVLGGFWACATYLGGQFIWPWTKQEEAIERLETVVETVQAEHRHTREDIAELKGDAALTAQALCAMTRKFAPENTPKGCTPLPIPQRNRGTP